MVSKRKKQLLKHTYLSPPMKLPHSRQQFLNDRIQPSAPSSVTVTITPHTHTDEYHVDVESNIEKKSTISSLLHAVAKLMPYLSPRKTEPVTSLPMRKVMTASINNKELLSLVPLEGEVQHSMRLKREGNRVHVTVTATAAADAVQSTWNVVAPILTPQMEGKEGDPPICLVADS